MNLSFTREPAVWAGLVSGVLALVAIFAPLPLGLEAALLGLIPVALALLVRQNVSPVPAGRHAAEPGGLDG